MSRRYKHGMNWIRQEKRLAIYMRDSFACVYCGADLERVDTTLTLDHVDRKGGNLPSNLVTACMGCNTDKNSWSVEEYLQRLTSDLGWIERAKARISEAVKIDIKPLMPEARVVIAARKTEGPF